MPPDYDNITPFVRAMCAIGSYYDDCPAAAATAAINTMVAAMRHPHWHGHWYDMIFTDAEVNGTPVDDAITSLGWLAHQLAPIDMGDAPPNAAPLAYAFSLTPAEDDRPEQSAVRAALIMLAAVKESPEWAQGWYAVIVGDDDTKALFPESSDHLVKQCPVPDRSA